MIDNKPAWLNFDEGRIVMDGDAVFFAETHLKDHLGNIRTFFWLDQQCIAGETGQQLLSIWHEY